MPLAELELTTSRTRVKQSTHVTNRDIPLGKPSRNDLNTTPGHIHIPIANVMTKMLAYQHVLHPYKTVQRGTPIIRPEADISSLSDTESQRKRVLTHSLVRLDENHQLLNSAKTVTFNWNLTLKSLILIVVEEFERIQISGSSVVMYWI